ncbi:MAG: hypothetical protein AABW91_01720 [Nanoarchaeota archaeon]
MERQELEERLRGRKVGSEILLLHNHLSLLSDGAKIHKIKGAIGNLYLVKASLQHREYLDLTFKELSEKQSKLYMLVINDIESGINEFEYKA